MAAEYAQGIVQAASEAQTLWEGELPSVDPHTTQFGMITKREAGYALASCPYSGYESDVILPLEVAAPGVVSVSDIVCFETHLKEMGQPQASGPLWKWVGSVNKSEKLE